MSRVRYLAAGLLFLSGIIHVAQLAMAALDAKVAIAVVFGAAYLIIAFFLFRANRAAYYFGAIVPFVGLLLATLGMLMNPTLMAAFFIAVDVVVVLCCFYLIRSRQSS